VTLERTVESGVLALEERGAQDPAATGTKAAALARARAAGLPVLPGFVITTTAAARLDDLGWVRDAWRALSDDGTRALVVRSSSPLEDTAEGSMAGRFQSVVDVTGWDAFVAAVRAVVASGAEVAEVEGLAPDDVPMAVLVQPLVRPKVGGVLFGVDPVTGRTDRRVVAVARGLPERLVSGEVSGSRYEIDRHGRRRAYDAGDEHVRIGRRLRQRLAGLSARCAELFGAPQDIEWALDGRGTLQLLQSRPVTTRVTGVPSGPVLGPGPIAETFPDPLAQLEQDLWAAPLREALHTVFQLLGAVSRRQLERSPLLVVVDGRVAVDLDLLEAAEKAPWYAFIRQSRSLRAAWRIGRLRAALAGLGEDVVARADAALLEVPNAADLTDRQLVAALENLRHALRSLHTYEMLVGLVLHPDEARLTGSSIALRVLAQARREGLDDLDVPRHHPIVLALTAPRIAAALDLPEDIAVPEWSPGDEDRSAVVREALRLRVRWVQEAGARFAWELGERLVRRGALREAVQVRDLDIEGLEMTVRDLAVTVPAVLEHEELRAEPLPARFRLSDLGRPVPVIDRHPHQGSGAGGGRGRGPVHVGADDVPDGAVVVVRTLDSRLAPILPRIAGLVAETGSVLAHLAILAREAGVATVVGLEGATECLTDGTLVEVDGTTGAVTVVPDPAAPAGAGAEGGSGPSEVAA
jgi:phosphohistidine swiveling domain-containing protein